MIAAQAAARDGGAHDEAVPAAGDVEVVHVLRKAADLGVRVHAHDALADHALCSCFRNRHGTASFSPAVISISGMSDAPAPSRLLHSSRASAGAQAVLRTVLDGGGRAENTSFHTVTLNIRHTPGRPELFHSSYCSKESGNSEWLTAKGNKSMLSGHGTILVSPFFPAAGDLDSH